MEEDGECDRIVTVGTLCAYIFLPLILGVSLMVGAKKFFDYIENKIKFANAKMLFV